MKNKTIILIKISIYNILLFSIPFILNSCEGYRCSEGIVVDSITQAPLDSVMIEVVTDNSEIYYTDAEGNFDVCNKMSGCVPDCKDITIRFSRNNYSSKTITNPEKDIVVQLERL